jgi:hypothetical protein
VYVCCSRSRRAHRRRTGSEATARNRRRRRPARQRFPEDDWLGQRLRAGPELVLRPVRPLTRCVMIDMVQERAVERNDLLKTLADHHELTFGVSPRSSGRVGSPPATCARGHELDLSMPISRREIEYGLAAGLWMMTP